VDLLKFLPIVFKKNPNQLGCVVLNVREMEDVGLTSNDEPAHREDRQPEGRRTASHRLAELVATLGLTSRDTVNG
jgi:hypothetical protein